jgi:hypothetical protein
MADCQSAPSNQLTVGSKVLPACIGDCYQPAAAGLKVTSNEAAVVCVLPHSYAEVSDESTRPTEKHAGVAVSSPRHRSDLAVLEPSARSVMADPVWDPAGTARAAILSIVSEYGPSILSSPEALGPALQQRLGDAPKQVALILGAARSGAAVSLREHLDAGMDADAAAQLAATSLIDQTAFDAAGCRWVAGEFAVALAPAAPVAPYGSSVVAPPTTADHGTDALSSPGVWAGVAASDGSNPRRRKRALALVGVVILVLGGLTIGAAVASVGPFAPSNVPLAQLMPDDTSNCGTSAISSGEEAFAHQFKGLTGLYACAINPIQGPIFAFQFDNAADFQVAAKQFNNVVGVYPNFSKAYCPVAKGNALGITDWYTNAYPRMAGQTLECFTESNRPEYVYFLPARNTFFTIVAGSNISFQALDKWFDRYGRPGPHGPGNE